MHYMDRLLQISNATTLLTKLTQKVCLLLLTLRKLVINIVLSVVDRQTYSSFMLTTTNRLMN